MGLPRATTFADISSDPQVQARFASIYASVDDVDLWIGIISEDHHPGAMVGELAFRILKDQFERLRDGDRYWYQRALPRPLVQYVERQTLATIIRRNTFIGRELQDDVFHVPSTWKRKIVPAAAAASDRIVVSRPYPNPTRGTVSIGLTYSGEEPLRMEAMVFDVQGRRVKTLTEGSFASGTRRISWDRTDESGRLVASGIYFIQLRSGSFARTERLLVLE